MFPNQADFMIVSSLAIFRGLDSQWSLHPHWVKRLTATWLVSRPAQAPSQHNRAAEPRLEVSRPPTAAPLAYHTGHSLQRAPSLQLPPGTAPLITAPCAQTAGRKPPPPRSVSPSQAVDKSQAWLSPLSGGLGRVTLGPSEIPGGGEGAGGLFRGVSDQEVEGSPGYTPSPAPLRRRLQSLLGVAGGVGFEGVGNGGGGVEVGAQSLGGGGSSGGAVGGAEGENVVETVPAGSSLGSPEVICLF